MYSFIFSYHVILVEVEVDLDPTPGKLEVSWAYILDGMPAGPPSQDTTHIDIHNCPVLIRWEETGQK